MPPERNDPCPCGSGRTYKACCLRSERANPVESLWRNLNRIDAELAHTLLAHVDRALAGGAAQKAVAEFYGPYGEGGVPERDAQLFFPWLLFSWAPAKRLWLETGAVSGRRTVGADFLARHASRLDDLSRRYLAAALDEPFSLYEVLSAEPGASLDLFDLLRERTFHVSERSASKTARPHDVVFAHLVTVDGLTTLSGTASIVLEPAFKLEILDLAERLGERSGTITSKVLFAEARPVRLTFLGLVERRLNPPIPFLQNTDGEALAPHRLRFTIEDPDAAFEALHVLDGTHSRADLLAEAKRDRGGRLTHASINWCRPGEGRSGGSLILGHLALDDRDLVVEVNSTERARRIRREIEKRLGKGARFVSDVVTSMERQLEEERSRPAAERQRDRERRREEEERILDRPEVREALARVLDEQQERWLDEKIPALGGKTPREAVRSKAGRAKVEALLEDFERRAGTDPFAPPVARLRRELGLE